MIKKGIDDISYVTQLTTSRGSENFYNLSYFLRFIFVNKLYSLRDKSILIALIQT